MMMVRSGGNPMEAGQLTLFSKTTVGDRLGRVTATVRQALARSDVIATLLLDLIRRALPQGTTG